MTHPNAKQFIGRIGLFEEKTERTPNERYLDDIDEDQIVYPDLVFTLTRDSGKYYRPVVIEKFPGRLVVIANRLFLRAAKKAGLEKIKFDFIPTKDSPAGESLMEKYGLQYAPDPEQLDFRKRFLFFNREPEEIDVSDIQGASNLAYSSEQCLQIMLPVKSASKEPFLIRKAFKKNGSLRSIDGIIDWGYNDYFL